MAGTLESPGFGDYEVPIPLTLRHPGGFRVNASVHRQLNRRKRRILCRIENVNAVEKTCRLRPKKRSSHPHKLLSGRFDVDTQLLDFGIWSPATIPGVSQSIAFTTCVYLGGLTKSQVVSWNSRVGVLDLADAQTITPAVS